MSRLLIVEDEVHLANGLRFNLELDGHAVEVITDGNEALAHLLRQRGVYDAVILDVMLPGKDGFEIVHALRESGEFVPVLILTARGRPEDVLLGFEAGADDYLAKPFELAILRARVHGLLRRRAWMLSSATAGPAAGPPPPPDLTPDPEVLTFAGKTLDMRALELRVGERAYHLTVMECELLGYLLKHAGRPVSRKAILEDVWGLREDTDTRAIDNFVVRLRRYIEDDPSTPRHLVTVRGVGYRFVPEPAASPA
jgi:DNA-binding response OmpR family regulator